MKAQDLPFTQLLQGPSNSSSPSFSALTAGRSAIANRFGTTSCAWAIKHDWWRETFNNNPEQKLNQIIVNKQMNIELTKLRDWLVPMLMNDQVIVK